MPELKEEFIPGLSSLLSFGHGPGGLNDQNKNAQENEGPMNADPLADSRNQALCHSIDGRPPTLVHAALW